MQDNFFSQFHKQDGRNGMTVQAADPTLPAKVLKSNNEASASNYAPGTAAAEQRIKEIEAANAGRIAEAELRKSEADARRAEADARNPQTQMSAQIRKDAIDGYHTAQYLRELISNMDEKYQAGPGSTSGLSGLADYFPTTSNKRFDDAANAARGTVGNAFQFTGGQLNTKGESELNVGPYLPQSGDRDAEIVDKMGYLKLLADNAEKKAVSTLGGIPDMHGNIVPADRMDASTALTGASGADATTQLAKGRTKDEVDPFLKKIGSNVGGMVSKGAPDAEILKYLRDNQIDPASTNVGKALEYRKTNEFKAWQRQNPGRPYPIGPEFYTKKVALGTIQNLANMGAQSAPGAAFISSANAVSGNHLKDINPQVETGMELLRSEHPGASLIGDAAGQAIISAAIPVGRFGRFGELARDAVYGAASSDLTPEGILGGAALNAGGGVLGRRAGDLMGVVANGIRPSPSLGYLHNAGVPLTIGQIARGTNTTAGRAISGLEDRAAGLPGYDAIINTARQRGMEGFDRAAFREAGGSGAIGSAGINELGDRVDGAYSFLDNVNLPLDAQYAGTGAGIRASLPNMTFGNNVGNTLNEIDRNSLGGAMTGRTWQDSLRAARDDAASINGQPFARTATNTLGDVQDNLVGLASRQGPADAAQQLGTANELYRNYRTLGNALDNGPAVARGEVIGPQRLDAAARQSARRFGGQAASVRGQRPFYGLSRAGADVLPSNVPDSGTAGRAVLMSALYGGGLGGLGAGLGAASNGDDRASGAQTGGEIGLAAALALLGPYSRTGQRGVQGLLLGQRPQVVRDAFNYFGDPSQNAVQSILQNVVGRRAQSSLGGATLRDMFLYPESR